MSKKSKSNQVIEKHLQEQEQAKYLQYKHEQRLKIYMQNPLVYFRRLQYTHENSDRAQFDLTPDEIEMIEHYINLTFSPEYLRKLAWQNQITVLTGN